MTRWRLTVEYDGGPFVGWQRQENGPSVQAALEDAVKAFSGEAVTIFGAGRTDSGVHALGQVAHFDLAKPADSETVRDAINFHLKPDPVAVLETEAVPDDFHSRFSATRRHYRYRILNRRAPATLAAGRVWHVVPPLDAAAMAAAAQELIGRHDFTSFRAAACQADSPVKTLDTLEIENHGDEIWIIASARSFLHHQVRNIAGTLKLVGEGKWTVARVAAALAARDRRKAGPTAPADGLYLTQVDY
ncbi:MAG: tRNA pseudouridine(38-40) synthase TruA [Alphaproteobacteria bacterium]|nr:tRNA pseudouridine(38-40) synthase TruA [Alphaproteobacteria bacterium]